jgi:RHS repeat-associated protein
VAGSVVTLRQADSLPRVNLTPPRDRVGWDLGTCGTNWGSSPNRPLGSTRALLGSSGAIVGTYAYDPYGRVIASSGTVTTPIQYAGGYPDTETGFSYLRARYYDPATAQFLTVDPLVDATFAAYYYGSDNPVNFTNPSGPCERKKTDQRRVCGCGDACGQLACRLNQRVNVGAGIQDGVARCFP